MSTALFGHREFVYGVVRARARDSHDRNLNEDSMADNLVLYTAVDSDVNDALADFDTERCRRAT